MSRFYGWDDDGEEFAGQFALQMANEERSLKGKRGQASLRALEAALLALPEKRLISGRIIDQAGGVCAMGALAKHLGKELPKPSTDDDYEDYFTHTNRIGQACGVPEPVAMKIAWMNDEILGLGFGLGSDYTDEQRYEHMLAWVRKSLVGGNP